MSANESGRQNARRRTITITVDELDDRTRAIAEMEWHDRKLVGIGRTRIGEELPIRAAENLSVARALADLVARLNTSASAARR